MKKRVFKQGMTGFPIGIAISFVISVIVSLCIGEGRYYPVRPELIEFAGNELNAVLLQTVLSGVVGAGFAMAAVIWEIDSWGIAKQTGVYFGIICVVMFPISYVTYWMEHSVNGVLSYMGIFVALFVCLWAIQYFVWKNKIDKLNDRLKNKESEV